MSAVVDSFALLDALVAGGVRHLVLCPGSRSAPLAYAAAAWEEAGALRIHPRVDERAAGFYALGLARSTGAPAAVLMTSGTAVPHLYPAVVEAAHTGTPLLVVSADRPWELRGVGASQTTTQVGMFTPHLRHSLDLPAGLGVELGQDDSLRRVSNVVGRAVVAAHQGPVHINVALRDPLHPAAPAAATSAAAPAATPIPVTSAKIPSAEAWTPATPAVAPSAGAAVSLPTHSQLVDWAQLRWDQHRQRILPPSTQETALVSHHASTGHHATTAVGSPSSPRGATVRASDVLDPQAPTVIIAADRGYQPPATADFAGALAARLEVPVLAEPSSGVREETWYCPHQQQVLTRWGGQVRQAIVVGTPTLSRPVGRLLARPDVRVIVLATTSDPVRPWPDLFGNAHWVGPDLEWDVEFAPQVRDWGRELLARARGLTAGIEAAPTAGLGVARAVWDSVEPDQILLAGASNAIRYLDLAAPRPARAQVFANRGQAGIDGTIATALGLHAGSGKAVRVLLGDLTAIHDVGSLALPSGAEADVDLVVIDDSGGQIFRTLEHGQAASESHYQQLFAMGVNVDYRALAAAFGWEFAELVWHEGGAGELAQILTQYRGGRRLVRVSCDHSQVGEQLRAVIAGG